MKEKRRYEAPELEWDPFEEKDVICASGEGEAEWDPLWDNDYKGWGGNA